MIADPTEISRLTAAPNMHQIWVSGNPFTRTHSSTYRVDIFNFFRETPGFTEDVLVDGTPPGMVERRHLIDRVFEKPPPHPTSQRLQSPPPLLHSRAEPDSSTSPVRVGEESPAAGRNAKKKKATRQRIVSLDGSFTGDGENQTRTKVDTPVSRVQADGDAEDYRRRLEALREEAGTGWLRVLSESGGLTENGIQETVAKT